MQFPLLRQCSVVLSCLKALIIQQLGLSNDRGLTGMIHPDVAIARGNLTRGEVGRPAACMIIIKTT